MDANVSNDKKIIYSDMQTITGAHKMVNDNTLKQRSWPFVEHLKK